MFLFNFDLTKAGPLNFGQDNWNSKDQSIVQLQFWRNVLGQIRTLNGFEVPHPIASHGRSVLGEHESNFFHESSIEQKFS